jgi:hypothetical protein
MKRIACFFLISILSFGVLSLGCDDDDTLVIITDFAGVWKVVEKETLSDECPDLDTLGFELDYISIEISEDGTIATHVECETSSLDSCLTDQASSSTSFENGVLNFSFNGESIEEDCEMKYWTEFTLRISGNSLIKEGVGGFEFKGIGCDEIKEMAELVTEHDVCEKESKTTFEKI